MTRHQISEKNITVIGGGPSGLMATISAAKQGVKDIRLIEKNPALGRKLLATGNGRCNLTNINCSDASETLQFFNSIGLLTRVEDEGRVYPYSGQAAAVQEILVNSLRDLQVKVYCGMEVEYIDRIGASFLIKIKDHKPIETDVLILASGGKAGPQYGSTGDGYRWVKALGHTVVSPRPSLVRLVSNLAFFKELKGVRAKGCAKLMRMNQVVEQETGEIQFTEDGLSGICIFNLSKHYAKGDMVQIDLMPDFSDEILEELLLSRVQDLENRSIKELLSGMINKKLVSVVLKEIALEQESRAGKLRRKEIQRIISILKRWQISIIGTKGWKEAQVTSGGVKLAEVDLLTMESKIVPNLYLAGELLDVDEKCGGYNLQWAWSSGMIAGKSAAAAISEK
ncbi:MAG: NAD(P)/FAD-dependent oxidoreductase [Anaerovoracaceae bacterium]|jgi:predicted Rossmann fold flavoprotein